MKVLIDSGHGIQVKGKQSCCGSIKEWSYVRDIAKRLQSELKIKGIDSELVVPEDDDIPLSMRCRRINEICRKHGKDNCVVVSLHLNAAGNGSRWYDASGWSVFVAPNASKNSKILAKTLYEEAEKRALRGNRSVPKEKYWVGDFAIVRNTLCPAVLTENMFMDNKHDVDFLMSERGKTTIVDVHARGIEKYMESCN